MVGRRVEGEREKEEDKKGGVRWAVFLELWEKKNVLRNTRVFILSAIYFSLFLPSFLFFFFSFLLIFAHFSTPISAHDPKKD